MGKLNYTNRKICGVKLGMTVKKDLLKRSTNGASRMATKDPYLDLFVGGKGLGDEGLELTCDGLIHSISTGGIKLEELNLSNNNISLAGLKQLSQVIRLSTKELKDLDLSNNNISIATHEDALIWEDFLGCFSETACLRKLDLSSNPLGPDRAFEILLRCYSRETPIILPKTLDSAVEESSDEEDFELDLDDELDDLDSVLSSSSRSISTRGVREMSSSPYSVYSRESAISQVPQMRRGSNFRQSLVSLASTNIELRGLRSTPYILLSNTGMTDISALHLSYLLQAHPTPQRLLPFLSSAKPGAAETLDSTDSTSGCSGIIYLPNGSLSNIGIRVLELAEAHRRDSPSISLSCGLNTRRMSDPNMSPARRRSSSLNCPIAFASMIGSTNEMDRSRSKIQGTILKESGIRSIELWQAALRTLIYSRAILSNDNSMDSSRAWSSSIDDRDRLHNGSCSLVETSPTQMDAYQVSPSGSYKSYRSGVNAPTYSPQFQKKGVFLPGRLPDHIWRHIIRLAADPNDILSQRQVKNVQDWGSQRETLMREKELAGKLPSLQIWRFLEGLNCLTYEL